MAEAWIKELDEATRIADDINTRIDEANANGMSRVERSRLLSSTKRKCVVLENKVGRLDNLLQSTVRHQLSEKELFRRQEMLLGLKRRIKQLDSSLKTSQNARDDLFSEGTRIPPVETNKTAGMDNYGLTAYQRQIMREQDEDLKDLEHNVISTKHIALTVNEELDLHTRLLDDIDQHADHTNSILVNAQKRLLSLSKRGTSLGCLCMMMLVIAGLILVILKLVHIL